MIDCNASNGLKNTSFLEKGYRIDDKKMDKAIDILFKLAEEMMMKEIEKKDFSFEDIFKKEKSREITGIINDYFYIEDYYIRNSIFSNRSILSDYTFYNVA